jgi:FAD/FMN-containing dehydrogenase
MAKAHTSWQVLPHGPIERLTENLWRVEGTLENMALKRVMTIARGTDGKLVVHSAIALNNDSMRAIDAFGDVAAIIVPNGYHRLDALVFAQRYPHAKVYGSSH